MKGAGRMTDSITFVGMDTHKKERIVALLRCFRGIETLIIWIWVRERR